MEADKKNVKITLDVECYTVTDCDNASSAPSVISKMQGGSVLSESILMIDGVSTSSICLVSNLKSQGLTAFPYK